MTLPEHHHWTRWWLKRFLNPSSIYSTKPNRIVLFDRALRQDVGEPILYPEQFHEALQQLRSLRQRDAEPIDRYVFCDDFGDHK